MLRYATLGGCRLLLQTNSPFLSAASEDLLEAPQVGLRSVSAVGHPLLSPVLAVCYYAAVLLRALLLRALLRTEPFTCEERPFKALLRARNTTA